MGVLQLLSAISNSEFFNVTNQIGTALANLLPDRVGNDVLKYNYTQAFLPGLITAATGLSYEPCLVSAGLTGDVLGEISCLLVACASVRPAHVSAQTEGLTDAATGPTSSPICDETSSVKGGAYLFQQRACAMVHHTDTSGSTHCSMQLPRALALPPGYSTQGRSARESSQRPSTSTLRCCI